MLSNMPMIRMCCHLAKIPYTGRKIHGVAKNTKPAINAQAADRSTVGRTPASAGGSSTKARAMDARMIKANNPNIRSVRIGEMDIALPCFCRKIW